MSDDHSLYLLRRAFEELGEDPATHELLLHARRAVEELAGVCLTARSSRRCEPVDRQEASAARAKLDRAIEALSGKSVRTVARLDLFIAIDEAVRLRDSLAFIIEEHGDPKELTSLPRGEYERELLREVAAVRRQNGWEYARVEDEPGLWDQLPQPAAWPEHATRAMRDPAQMAHASFAAMWPEYAKLLTTADVGQMIKVWQNRGRPRVKDSADAFQTKWATGVKLVAQAGLGDVTADALKSDWARWSRANPRRPPDDDER